MNNSVGIFLYGSSLIKNIFQENKHNYVIKGRLLWDSPISMFSKGTIPYEDLNDNVLVHNIFTKNVDSFFDKVIEEDWLVLDLYTITTMLFQYEDGYYPQIKDFISHKAYKSVENRGNIIAPWDLKDEDWKYAIDCLLDKINKSFSCDHIVLIKNKGASVIHNGKNTIREQVYFYNEWLEEVYQYFIQKSNAYVIDICKHYCANSYDIKCHKFINFDYEFYVDCFKIIEIIVRNNDGIKYYDNKNVEYSLNHFIQFYDDIMKFNLHRYFFDLSDPTQRVIARWPLDDIVRSKTEISNYLRGLETTINNITFEAPKNVVVYHGGNMLNILKSYIHCLTYNRDKVCVLVCYQHMMKYVPDTSVFSYVIPYTYALGLGSDASYFSSVDRCKEYIVKTFDAYFDEWKIDLKKAQEIIVGSYYCDFAAYLNWKGIHHNFAEEGNGQVATRKNECIDDKLNYPATYEIRKKMHLYDGKNDYVDKRYCLMSAQVGINDDKAVDFDYFNCLSQMDNYGMNKIFSIYEMDIDSIPELHNCSLLLTSWFIKDGKKVESSEGILLWQKVVDYYLKDEKVVIKKHPADTNDYSVHIPEAYTFQQRFPSELLPYLGKVSFNKAVAVASTSISAMKNFIPTCISISGKVVDLVDKLEQLWGIGVLCQMLKIEKVRFLNFDYDTIKQFYESTFPGLEIINSENCDTPFVSYDNKSMNLILKEAEGLEGTVIIEKKQLRDDIRMALDNEYICVKGMTNNQKALLSIMEHRFALKNVGVELMIYLSAESESNDIKELLSRVLKLEKEIVDIKEILYNKLEDYNI